jgi:DMSO/TMAO reductase YedYZ molybdopterin-dependent catalytic subunit
MATDQDNCDNSEEKESDQGLTRRSFITNAAITASAIALGANGQAKAAEGPMTLSEYDYEFGVVHRAIWEKTVKMPGVRHPRMHPLSLEEKFKHGGIGSCDGNFAQYANWFVDPHPDELFIHCGSSCEMRWEKMREQGYLVPNEMFYTEGHYPTPDIDVNEYRLAIDGDGVANPLTLTYEDLIAMPSVTLTRSLICGEAGIGHFVHRYRQETPGMNYGYGAIGVAEWTGVPLHYVLDKAGIKKDAVWVMPVGLDTPRNFMQIMGKPIGVAKALEPDTLLAYKMNGKPLPADHGYPVRALVSGYVGPASIKWVGRIEVWTRPLDALMTTRYGVLISEAFPPTPPSATGVLMTEAKVCSSLELAWPATLPAAPQRITGRSWSPTTTIAKVDITFDSGKTWQQAKLLEPNLEKAWCRWEIGWNPQPGLYGVRVRATDSAGISQPDDNPYNFHGYVYNAVIDHPIRVV